MKLNVLRLLGASVGLAAAIPLMPPGMRTYEYQQIPGNGAAAAGERSHATKHAVVEPRAALKDKPFNISDPDVPQEQKDFTAVFNDSMINPFLPPKLPPKLPPTNLTFPDVVKNNSSGHGNSTTLKTLIEEIMKTLVPGKPPVILKNLTLSDTAAIPGHGNSSALENTALIRAHARGSTNSTRVFQPQSRPNRTITDDTALTRPQDHHHANSTRRRRPQSANNMTMASSAAFSVNGTRVFKLSHASGNRTGAVPKGGLGRRDDDGRAVEKRDFLKTLEEFFRSSSPTSGWRGVEISPEEMKKFGHPQKVPQWGGHNPPISDEDFCTLARSMQWLTHRMVPEVEKLVPSNSTEPVKDAPKQRSQLARVARMMVVWEKLLKTMKLQLVWTYELGSQPHCAVCYIEYCHAASVLLAALRDRGTNFEWNGYERAVMHNHARNVGDSQRDLARILHMRSRKSLFDGKIADDKSAWSEKLQSQYGLGTQDSLRTFVNQRDPIAHPKGIFYEAEQAWRFKWPVHARRVGEENARLGAEAADKTTAADKATAADETTDADELKKRSLPSNSTIASGKATPIYASQQTKKPKEDLKKDRKALGRQKSHFMIPMTTLRKVWRWLGAIQEVLAYPATPYGHYGDSDRWNDKAPVLDPPQQAANDTMRRIEWTVDQQSRMREIADELAKDRPDVD